MNDFCDRDQCNIGKPGYTFMLDLPGYDIAFADEALRKVDITNYKGPRLDGNGDTLANVYSANDTRPLRDFGDFMVIGRENGGIRICARETDQKRLTKGLRNYLESLMNKKYVPSAKDNLECEFDCYMYPKGW